MIKQILKFGILILIFSLISCDNEENFTNDNVENNNINPEVHLLNNRMYFQDKTSFHSYYDEIKKKDDDEVANILNDDFYAKGFYSLKPIVNENTEKEQFKRHFEKINEMSFNKSGRSVTEDSFLDNLDDLEEIFGEDFFISFLNQNAELQIADTIYQYTDHGLFKVQADKYNKLVEFENVKQEIHNLGDINNLVNYLTPCDLGEYLGNPNGGYARVAPDVVNYIAQYEYPCDDSGSGTGTGTGTGSSNPPSYNETYNEIAAISQTLNVCSGDEPWLPNLFGTVKVCIDKYESRRRVKTKYWDVDFGLGFSIGVKVKHQYKGWTGVWRKENTSRVALGINSISWKFDIPTYSPPQNPNHARLYADGLAWDIIRDQSWDYSLGSVAIPNLPFAYDVDAVIEIETFIGEISVNSPLPDEQQVRNMFYSTLFDKVKGIMQTERNKELTKLGLVVKTPTHMYVQLYDFSKYCSNCKKQRSILDWGIATPQINYTFGNGSPSTSFTYNSMDFSQPRSTGANVFGMAKHNGTWHGSRMIFEQNN